MEECEKELYAAIQELLWKMRGICVKHKLEKKLTQKEKKSLFDFGFVFHERMAWAIDEKLIFIEGTSDKYGHAVQTVVKSGIPTSWLWRKNWEQDFIKEYVAPCSKEQEEWRKEEAEASYERYKELDKIYGKIKK